MTDKRNEGRSEGAQVKCPSEVELRQRHDACLNEQSELIKQIEALGEGEMEDGDAEAQESLRGELALREAEQEQIGRMIELAKAEVAEQDPKHQTSKTIF